MANLENKTQTSKYGSYTMGSKSKYMHVLDSVASMAICGAAFGTGISGNIYGCISGAVLGGAVGYKVGTFEIKDLESKVEDKK
jgi:predicted ABC-type sugar transport system permease subunit